MTAFYMFRLYFLTFEGPFRGGDLQLRQELLLASGKPAAAAAAGHHSKTHESAWPMTLPLVLLAVPSILVGLLGTPWHSRFAALLDPEEAAEMATKFNWP